MEDSSAPTPAKSGIQIPMLRDVMTVLEASSAGPPVRVHSSRPTLRDALAVLFRHRLLIAAGFLTVSCLAAAVILLKPRVYESRMKILIKRERIQMVLTPEPGSQAANLSDITPEDINSEVELLKSRDLLEKVVVKCGLDKSPSGAPSDNPQAIPLAAAALEGSLDIQAIPKSHMIEISYASTDSGMAARVLNSLTVFYLEKHLSVHNPPGVLAFFQQQTAQYKAKLESIEKELSKFGKNEKVLSFDLEKDLTLRTLNDFEARLHENEAALASLDQRIDSLKAQLAATPNRITAQVKTSDDPLLLQQLKTTLLNLELKKTELLTKFEPGYRTVQELETQIAQTREALVQAEKNSLRDETTDLNKTHLWLDEELARAQAERATLKARSESIQRSIGAYQSGAQKLNNTEIRYRDLARAAKSTEEKYLLYQQREEEARISEAMDRKRIVNAVVAEEPTIPAFPSGPSRSLMAILGFLFACLTSIGLAFIADSLDPSFRTPEEVENALGTPVLACISRHRQFPVQSTALPGP